MRSEIPREELMQPGHLACQGCGGAIIMRHCLKALGQNTIVVIPACCWTIIAGQYPYNALKVPILHTAFETSGAAASGVRAALDMRGKYDTKVLAFAGDGGTFDIGLQSLSGAAERNEDIIYICYDNEAYMNTGIQRSSATPLGAATSTSPVGEKIPGKQVFRKDLTAIMIAHRIPYTAQASVHNPRDFMGKVQKALAIDGPAFINVLGTCHRGWRFKMEDAIEMAKLAVETCYWPLYEVENGTWKLTYKPKNKLPLDEWTKRQGRFAHLYKEENKHILELAQKDVDEQWGELLKRCGEEITGS